MHCSSQCSLKKIERRKIKSENTKQNSFSTFHDFLSLSPFLSFPYAASFICTQQQRQYLSEEPIRNSKMKCIARIKCIKLSKKKHTAEHRRPFYYFFSQKYISMAWSERKIKNEPCVHFMKFCASTAEEEKEEE